MNEVIVQNAHGRSRAPVKETLKTARRVLNDEGSSSSMVGVLFVNDSYCRKLNRKYLAHPYATDVLAFPLERGERLEGEIYVNLDRAKVQAKEHGVSFKNEVARLVVHGILHLLGYRDSTRKLRAEMTRKENEYLKRYVERHELVR
jgi:probable rRNA maturation factor